MTANNDETSTENPLSKAYKNVLVADLASNRDVAPNAESVSEHLLNQILFIRNNLNNPEALGQVEAIASAALATGVQNMQLAGELAQKLEKQERLLDSATQENKKLEEQLAISTKKAQRDPLTQALNRDGFNDSYAETVKNLLNNYDQTNGKLPTLSIAMFDLDNFKRVNDTYGHTPNGDLVLQEFVQFLEDQASDYMRQNPDIFIAIGRFGGEEFAVLYSNPDTKKKDGEPAINWIDPRAEEFFTKLRENYSKTVSSLNGDQVRNSTSIGYATDIRVTNIGKDDKKIHLGITLKRADDALYNHKARPDKPTFESRISRPGAPTLEP